MGQLTGPTKKRKSIAKLEAPENEKEFLPMMKNLKLMKTIKRLVKGR